MPFTEDQLEKWEGAPKGRILSEDDPRDRRFPGTRLLSRGITRRFKRHYSDVLHLNQGSIGQCVTVSLAHVKHDGPFTHRPYWVDRPAFNTIQLYCRAQQIWGLSPTYCQDRRMDYGTTMRSGALAAREGGWIHSFHWFWELEPALDYLTSQGPLWVGTEWTEGMEKPDSEGFIHPTGRSLGGHAYKLQAISWKHEWVEMKNSWDLDWGRRGTAKITFEELGFLLSLHGEFIAIQEKRV